MRMALDRAVGFDLLLMIFGFVMALVSAFAILALSVLNSAALNSDRTYVALNDGGMHPAVGAITVLMLGLGIWNLFRSLQLVNSPDRRQAAFILLRSLVALAPIALISILWIGG